MAWDYNPETGEEIWVDDAGPVPEVAFGGNPQLGSGLSPEDEEILAAIQGPAPQMKSETVGQVPTVSQSQGVSHSGLNRDTLGYLETQGMKGYKAQDAQAFNKATAQANEMYAPFAAAAEQERAATEKVGKLQADRVALDAELKGNQQKYMEQYAIDNQKDYEQSMAKTREYAAQYETQLKELATMGVNPGRLYQNMTKGEKAGTLFSAFISDFLGAKGIKTNAMNYINQAIDRDIESQVNAINTKGKVVDGFRQMWDMQRMQSTSDFEAKLRMRGVMLESFKMGIAAKLGQMDSEIARAQVPLALAAVDKDLAKVKADVIKYRSDQYNAEAQRNVSMRGQNMQASMQEDAQRHAIAMKKLENEAKSPWDPSLFIRDAQGNVINQAPDKETRRENQKKIIGYENFIRKIGDVTERIRETGKTYAGPLSKTVRDSAAARYESAYNEAIASFVKETSGAQASDAEVERLQKAYKFSDFATGIFAGGEGGAKTVERVWADRGISNVEDMWATVNSSGIPVPPELAKQQKGGATEGSLATTRARATDLGTIATGEDKPLPNTVVQDEISRVKGPEGRDLVNLEDGSVEYEKLYEFLADRGRVELGEKGYPRLERGAYGKEDSAGMYGALQDNMPGWLDAMYKLSERATAMNATKEEWDQAVEFLTDISSEDGNFLEKGDEFEDKRAAAEMFLYEVLTTGYRGGIEDTTDKR